MILNSLFAENIFDSVYAMTYIIISMNQQKCTNEKHNLSQQFQNKKKKEKYMKLKYCIILKKTM